MWDRVRVRGVVRVRIRVRVRVRVGVMVRVRVRVRVRGLPSRQRASAWPRPQPAGRAALQWRARGLPVRVSKTRERVARKWERGFFSPALPHCRQR